MFKIKEAYRKGGELVVAFTWLNKNITDDYLSLFLCNYMQSIYRFPHHQIFKNMNYARFITLLCNHALEPTRLDNNKMTLKLFYHHQGHTVHFSLFSSCFRIPLLIWSEGEESLLVILSSWCNSLRWTWVQGISLFEGCGSFILLQFRGVVRLEWRAGWG